MSIYKASQAITNVFTSQGKSIVVAYVTRTNAWERTFIAEFVKDSYVSAVEKYKDALKSNTAKVAMMYVDLICCARECSY